MWSPTHVQIIVQRARNVIAKGKNGTNDAYVLIQNGKEKFQTSVKEQSIDPVWHEECDLLLENKETDVIKLTVFHRNLFGLADEFLGQALVSLKDIDIYERPKSRWYSLESRSHKKNAKFRGDIEVRITFIVKSHGNDKNEKIKKKTGNHQSLLDISGALKNDSNKSNPEKNDYKSGPPRKFSIAGYNRVPKLATRSLSFKLESLNTRRKSLVEKFMRRQDSYDKKDDKYAQELEESNVFNVQNERLVEDLNKTQEEEEEMFLDEKPQEISSNIIINSDNRVKIEVKNEMKSEVVEQIEPEMKSSINTMESSVNTMENSINTMETKSSSSSSMNGSLKRAMSSNNVLLTMKQLSKPERERSLTLTSAHEKSKTLPQFHAPEPKICQIEEITNNSSLTLKQHILRQTSNKESLLKCKLNPLKNFERRHTISINEMVPNLMHSSKASEKRATQASPDSLYSSFESLINKKTKTNYYQKYDSLNKEELIQLIETQQLTIFGLNEQINNLEEYIDNLLVRVIENSPRILQNSYKIQSLLKI